MITGNILVVDDEDKLRGLLKRTISLEGHLVHEAAGLRAAEKILGKEDIQVIVCDVKLPDGNGLDFVRTIKFRYPAVNIILLTGYAQIPDVVEAMRAGVFDYLSKGTDNDKLLPLIKEAVEKALLQKRVGLPDEGVAQEYGFDNIIGQSSVLLKTLSMARKVASSDATVLLSGETGSGKQFFARAIHAASSRIDKPFKVFNCSTLSKNLPESELFGYKTIAGGAKDRPGLIEEANGGTLFLDEIGGLPDELQSKLLRVLETRQIFKTDSEALAEVDVRIITATSRPLQKEVNEGKFREDLFYRLNVFPIEIPSLRDRKKDIPVLARYFMKLYAGKMNKTIEGMNREFLSILERQSWKGNVRELKNVIERAVIVEDGPELTPESLPLEFLVETHSWQPMSAFDLASVEKLHIQRVLNYTKGNKVETARLLNIGLTTVYRKMEEYGLV